MTDSFPKCFGQGERLKGVPLSPALTPFRHFFFFFFLPLAFDAFRAHFVMHSLHAN